MVWYLRYKDTKGQRYIAGVRLEAADPEHGADGSCEMFSEKERTNLVFRWPIHTVQWGGLTDSLCRVGMSKHTLDCPT